jgi:hypothetical protein
MRRGVDRTVQLDGEAHLASRARTRDFGQGAGAAERDGTSGSGSTVAEALVATHRSLTGDYRGDPDTTTT